MVIIYFLLIFIFNQVIYSSIINNPIKINDKKFPFVPPYSDNDYYYIITTGQQLKINKQSGSIANIGGNDFSNELLYCFDKSNYSYIYQNWDFYNVSYPFNKAIPIPLSKNVNSSNVNYIGCIPQDNDFIIYGSDIHYLFFNSLSQDDNYNCYFEKVVNEASCKFTENEEFICSIILEKKLDIIYFEYDINTNKKKSFLH